MQNAYAFLCPREGLRLKAGRRGGEGAHTKAGGVEL